MLRSLALSVLLFLTASGVSAQERTYDCPEINPENQAMAEQLVALSKSLLEDPDVDFDKVDKDRQKLFGKLTKKISKSKEDLVSVGTYFLEHDDYPSANYCAKTVYAVDPLYIPGLMFAGEVYMKAQNWGAAGQKFDEVLAQDSANINALKRNAFVYKNVNPYVAIEALNKIKAFDPSNVAADKELGDIYYNHDEYKDAIAHYNTYYQATPKDLEHLNIKSCENYLTSLYAVGEYEKVATIADEVLPLDSQDVVLHRMKFFAKMELMSSALNYDKALQEAKDASAYLTDAANGDSVFVYRDYIYAALLAKERGDKAATVSWYEKATAKDTTQFSVYKDLSNAYANNGDTEKAINAYNIYLKKKGNKVDVNDYYGLGNMYVRLVNNEKDATKKQEYIAAGDAAFNKALELSPNNYRIAFRQAGLHVTDSSKPQEEPKALYEKALNMMPTEGDEAEEASTYRLQAAQYLAFYYIQHDTKADLTEARKYVNIMLEADSEDSNAQTFDKYLKSQGK